jgi:hypothetical protein
MNSNELECDGSSLLAVTVDALASTELEHQTANPASEQTPQALFTNKQTLQLIQDFLSAEKPEGIGPSEVGLTVCLMACRAMDHPVTHSHQALAQMLGCDARTIMRSEETLKRKEYITQDSRKGCSKLTMLNLEKLPTAQPMPVRPTPDAEKLVQRYVTALDKHFPQGRRKRRKTWLKSQAWNAQKILNRCGGDLELACRMIGHALGSPLHRETASKDLYKLWGRWKLVEKSFGEMLDSAKRKPDIPDVAIEAPTEGGEQ